MQNTIIFWVGSIIGLLVGFSLCQIKKAWMYIFFALMIFSTIYSELSITFLADTGYKIATRGFVIHISYLFALILFFSMLVKKKEYPLIWWVPLTGPFLLLILYSVISWLVVSPDTLPRELIVDETNPLVYPIKRYPLFEIHQLMWGFFIMWVTANFTKDALSWKIIFYIFVFVLMILVINSLYQRYWLTMYRVSRFEHINNFTTYVGMVALFLIPIAFYTKKFSTALMAWLAITCGLLSIILSISRAAIVASIAVGAVTVILCYHYYKNARNLLFVFLALIVSLILFIKAAHTLAVRFNTEYTRESIDERFRAFEAGVMMAKDHFFGVGLGNFSAWNHFKYSDISGSDPLTIAHNIWYLTLAELGFPGLFLYIIYWLRYFHLVLQTFLLTHKNKKNSHLVFLIACFSAIIFLHLMSLVHFTARVGSIFILSQILIGLTIRLYWETKKIKQQKRHDPLITHKPWIE